MSLLMDALKRAEEAKRLGQQAASGAEASPTLTPSPNPSAAPEAAPQAAAESATTASATTATTALPPLPDRLELLDKEFFGDAEPAHKPPPFIAPPAAESRAVGGRAAPASAGNATPVAARTLFDAKQPPKSSRPFMLFVAIGTLLAVIVIVAYFWWQLQPHSRPVEPAAAPMTALPPAQSAPSAPLAPAALSPAPAQSTATLPAPKDPIDMAAGKAPQAPKAPKAPRAADRNASRAAAIRGVDEGGGIHFSASRARVDPALDQAYALLQRGDRKGAQIAYHAALRNDPNSLDALHGLAAIAVLNQDNEAAIGYYQKALELDPRDPVARAGMGSLPQSTLNGQSNAQAAGNSESRLRSALSEQPASGPLNFALGNLLAASGRWPEAQQAYFQAVTADSDNPDYLFNLAVSLDQLRKGPLAAQYYQRALSAATQRSHSFNTTQASERLKALQP